MADALRALALDVTFCVLNDGSKDETANILARLAEQYPELRVVNKPNSGHAQTCLEGYRIALREGTEWVFQVDSDGQCDPRFSPASGNRATPTRCPTATVTAATTARRAFSSRASSAW